MGAPANIIDAASFTACRQRIIWANEKLNALVLEWDRLHKVHPSTVTFDPKGNRKFDVMVESGIQAIPIERSLIFGEVLYHIRAALDGAVYACVIEKTGRVDPEREKVAGILTGMKKPDFDARVDRMGGINKTRRAMLEALQPYYTPTNALENTIAGYRPSLELLHRLAIIDRHQRLHVIGTILRSTDFRIIPPDGYTVDYEKVIDFVYVGTKSKIGEVVITGPETTTPIQVQFDGQLGIEIAIDEGSTSPLKGQMLIERINAIMAFAWAMIEMLEKANG